MKKQNKTQTKQTKQENQVRYEGHRLCPACNNVTLPKNTYTSNATQCRECHSIVRRDNTIELDRRCTTGI
jgi:hypothetical protein